MPTHRTTAYGNITGPTYSKFRACVEIYGDNNGSSGYTMYRQFYCNVTQGDFYGTNVTSSWGSSGSISGPGNYLVSGVGGATNIAYGSTYTQSGSCQYTSSTTYRSSVSGSWTVPRPTYTIAYNANGGSGAPGSQTKTYGVTLVLSTTVPTRSGYKFLGWATTSTATTAQYQPGANFTANATTTLYAVWQLDIFYIYFNSNGGTGGPEFMEKQNEVDINLPSTKPTRKRHNFLGWATDKDATSATYQPGGVFSLNQDTVLYAVWQLTDDYILIKSTGTCEAVEFIEDTSGPMFQDGGKVHATEFIETNDGILIGNVMYFGELEEV